GQGALARPDGAQVLHAARSLAERCGLIKDGWNGFNVLHTAAGRVGALDLGFVPGAGGRDLMGIFDACRSGEIDTVFLLGADEFDMERLSGAFVIYQGHHGDAGAHRADVVLPGAAFTEKHATYVNTEGRPQRGVLAVNAPGEAREDWRILRALSEALGARLPYDTLDEAQRRMAEIAPHLSAIDRIEAAAWGAFGAAEAMGAAPFRSPIDNYYMTDPISRASETMAECTRAFVANRRATGTDGR
ncbi:MAG TPA: molybdopterin-dependent oxidoreductase, partial [Alphaproteobacteria bacterium]|nr:molybdopterin-dependent oxidoreductase [Alphaproteobacteria bacterium]